GDRPARGRPPVRCRRACASPPRAAGASVRRHWARGRVAPCARGRTRPSIQGALSEPSIVLPPCADMYFRPSILIPSNQQGKPMLSNLLAARDVLHHLGLDAVIFCDASLKYRIDDTEGLQSLLAGARVQ